MLQLGAKATGGEAIRGGGDRICADRKTEVRRRLPTCMIQTPDKSVRMPRSRKAAHSGSMIQQENEREAILSSKDIIHVVQCIFRDLPNVPFLGMTLKQHDSSCRSSTLVVCG